MRPQYIPSPRTIGGKTFWPVVSDGCTGCVGTRDRMLCAVIPVCAGVIYLDDTPENRARWVAQRLEYPSNS
jgi:hypothetical protein